MQGVSSIFAQNTNKNIKVINSFKDTTWIMTKVFYRIFLWIEEKRKAGEKQIFLDELNGENAMSMIVNKNTLPTIQSMEKMQILDIIH